MDAGISRGRLETTSVRWGRGAVIAVLIISALVWFGWATGIHQLTRFYPTWPQMAPWTALWLAGLGTAILLQSGRVSPPLVWAARGLSVSVGVLAAVVLAEYVTDRSFGMDQVWFRESVPALPSGSPGRPSSLTALSTLLLAVVVTLSSVTGRAAQRGRTGLLIVAMVAPNAIVFAHLFDTLALLSAARSLGMAVATAASFILLGAATVLIRPDQGPVAWWLAQPNRSSILRMGVIVGGFPLSVGLSRHAALAMGAEVASALALSTAVGTLAVAGSMFYLNRQERSLIAAKETERALLRANSDGMLDAQALLEAVRDPDGQVVDLVCRSVNRAACSYLGVAEQDLVGHSAMEDPANFEASGLMWRYLRCMESGEPLTLYDLPRVSPVHHEIRYYDLRASRVTPQLLSITWSDVTERFQAADRIREADERYRRLIDNAAIGMCIITPDGHFEAVNEALCQLLGYDAEALMQKDWRELTVPEYLEADAKNINDLVKGRADSFRLVKQYIHADGRLIWGDLSTSCVRDADGQVERFISQIIDITAAMEATERNNVLAQRLERERERLAAELRSAADYMSSIMPRGLTGEVAISSRYLPSRELGGDCFDYTWIDDDHLLIYLIDVSGHGIEPALLSVSVHNLIRSGSLGRETLLSPAAVLAELNRLFQMDRQGDHYFTMWYGIYQASTLTLTYANAGAPAAFSFNSVSGSATDVIELPSTSRPVGMFEDTEFTARDFVVPHPSRLLIYSDGASEIPLAEGGYLSAAAFVNVCNDVAGSPNSSLDDLITELRALTPTGFFEDDCSLIELAFE